MRTHQHADGYSEELAAIVLRAEGLGFCRWRVATALGITPANLDAIEQRAGLTNANVAAPARTPRRLP
jgi:transcriptional regulator